MKMEIDLFWDKMEKGYKLKRMKMEINIFKIKTDKNN